MENKMTPKDFFLQLGIIVTLYVSIVALISFLFTVINIALPQVNEFYRQNSGLAWSMSVFIIAYPVLVYLMFKTNKYFIEFPAKKELAIKKWFTYLTIFLTALTIAIDLIVLLYTFLQGEQITLRFILKILVVVVVALTVFWVALKDLKGNFLGHSSILKKTFLIVSIVIVALISVGFYFNGSPQQARLALEDNQRVSDLQYIQTEVVSYWDRKGALPTSLNDLNDPLNYVSVPVDPETMIQYEYSVKSPLSFEICANFKTVSNDDLTQAQTKQMYPNEEYFTHTEGRNCFERTIDPELRKPNYVR
jgi:hypothetical protein